MNRDFECWKDHLTEMGYIEPKEEQVIQIDSPAPVCAVCGKHSNTQQQSILHPDPRLLCWPCAEAEVRECERVALERRTK